MDNSRQVAGDVDVVDQSAITMKKGEEDGAKLVWYKARGEMKKSIFQMCAWT